MVISFFRFKSTPLYANFIGMKTRDGFLRMENQDHLLEYGKKSLLCMCRGLGKEVGQGIHIQVILKICLRKERKFKLIV